MKHSRSTVPAEPAWSAFPDLAPAGDAAQVRAAAETKAALPGLMKVDRHQFVQAMGGARASTLSFTNMHTYGELLVRYLKARKDVFIDRLHWSLPNVDGMEFDQYDTPLCRWVIIHEFGEVLAGIRLVPTTARCGTYTYMLRDAQHGLLESIPSDVLFFPAPVEDQIWEASRLFITDHVAAQRRSVVQFLLMQNMILTATGEGARHVIGIVPAVWSRWLRRLGLYAVPVGPRFEIEGTVSQAALFNVADQLAWAQIDMREPG